MIDTITLQRLRTMLCLSAVAVLAMTTAQAGAPKTFETFPLNVQLFHLVNGHHTPLTDHFFYYVCFLGSAYMLIPALICALIWRRKKALALLIAVVIETAIVQVLKSTFEQPRPTMVFPQTIHLVPRLVRLIGDSFPSGDTAVAFVIAWVFLRGERWYIKAPLLLYALLIAYERMYVGFHFPLDVTTGAAIGILAGEAALRLLSIKRRANKAETPEQTTISI